MMWWIRCIREIFLGEIRGFRPSGAGGLSAVFWTTERTEVRILQKA